MNHEVAETRHTTRTSQHCVALGQKRLNGVFRCCGKGSGAHRHRVKSSWATVDMGHCIEMFTSAAYLRLHGRGWPSDARVRADRQQRALDWLTIFGHGTSM
jgi:hypothetical protein